MPPKAHPQKPTHAGCEKLRSKLRPILDLHKPSAHICPDAPQPSLPTIPPYYWTFLKNGGRSAIFVFSHDIKSDASPTLAQI
jgi:hypothetical protein